MTFAKCKLMRVELELFSFFFHIFMVASNGFTSFVSIADMIDGLQKLTTDKLKIKCYTTLIQLRAF